MADHEGSTRPRVVIVGGVAGGASCAARLRRCCEDAEITMIERGPYVSYANCGMPYAVGNVVPDDKLVVTQPSTFRDRFKIDVRVNTNAVRIDRERKILVVEETDNPEAVDEIGYDHLVLATGARAFMPPWPGADLPGIFHLRTIPETLAVKAWIADHGSGEAVVVGGGFIGLELAENLVALGVTTTLVEFAGQICPPADPSMAGLILDGALAHVAATHGSEKLCVRLGEGVESFAAAAAGEEGDGNQQQILVNTNKGNQISASFVVVCVGVRPESGLAVDAGLDTGRHDAVVVDEYMTTSDRSILAVGDVVAKTDLVTGQPINLALAGPANRQGRTAADVIALRVHAALAGNEPSYPPKLGFAGVIGTWVLGFCGMVAAGTGANAAALRRADIPFRACVVHPAHHVSYYPGAKKMALKLLYGPEDGRVLGAQAVGEAGVERRIDVIASYIKMGATVWDLKEAELCYAPAFGAAKDPVNLAGFVATNDLEGTSPLIWWHEHEVSPDDNHVYLDVRNQDEWDEFSVDGFVLVPLNDLRGRVEGILGAPRHDLAVFVSCAVGQRAHYAARILIEMGYAVKSFAGGVKTYRALNRAQTLMADAS